MKNPYYAVIFTSVQSDQTDGYLEMAQKMETLAKKQPGYLGMEHARSDIGITISYWQTLADIKNWKEHLDHKMAQEMGRKTWYTRYRVRICLVERDYEFVGN